MSASEHSRGVEIVCCCFFQAKNEGNEAFKAADYPKAIERYTEALKRGPPGQWDEAYKCFSNRAACYTKLGAMPEGAWLQTAYASVPWMLSCKTDMYHQGSSP